MGQRISVCMDMMDGERCVWPGTLYVCAWVCGWVVWVWRLCGGRLIIDGLATMDGENGCVGLRLLGHELPAAACVWVWKGKSFQTGPSKLQWFLPV